MSWKPEIDATDWLVVRTEHLLGADGYITRLELEHNAAGNAPETDDEQP